MTGQFQRSLVVDLNPVQMLHSPALISKEEFFMEDNLKKIVSTSLILIQW